MKIIIISGFLGAGKTTFIKSLTKHMGDSVAILENEYGSLGVDGEILQESMPSTTKNIWELAEGCICCSMKGDFAASVLTIANAVNPEYLIVEPTGVGMLSKVVSNLQQIQYERIQLMAPITIVDGNSFNRYVQEYKDLYLDQISGGKSIVVSKMEHSDSEAKYQVYESINKINNNAKVYLDHYSLWEDDTWKKIISTKYDGSIIKPEDIKEAHLPDSYALSDVSVTRPERLILMLEDCIAGRYGNVFRAKGVVPSEEGLWFRFDLADRKYSITGSSSEEQGKAVFIGTDLKKQELEDLFISKDRKIRYRSKRK